MKVNAPLTIEVALKVRRLINLMKEELALGVRRSRGPGRPAGEGNLVADVFERALREHPEWMDEWYREGLIDKPASKPKEKSGPDYSKMEGIKRKGKGKRRGTDPEEEASNS